MFDFLKNLTKSDEEKQQEAFSAYLDNTLTPNQRLEFEALMAEDADLRAEMELAQALRQQMNEMPRRSVPRSFTLDPNVYGAPQKEPLVQAYPFLRAATVMTAFFFVIALGLSVFTTQGSGGDMASVAQTAMEPAPAFDAPLAESEIAMEEIAEEAIVVEEEVAVEEPAEEESAETIPLPTMALNSTKSTEIVEGEELFLEEEMADMEAPAEADSVPQPGAPAGAVDGEAPTPTAIPTATVSLLPRLDATATAVPRAIEPTTLPPDEIANAVDDETAVDGAPSVPEPSSGWSLTTSQVLLMGLGILLLVLIVVTLLTRRKI